ncbi:alpha/beta hydrolase family protein [Flavobacterium sp. W21_SRS_FM6]|uniref:alpha/beta hydrolase family protein n=1 Tax=Flavobacterium sp. W21_SRS_FM6 TaxID=3240268 RepID=UPI003F918735
MTRSVSNLCFFSALIFLNSVFSAELPLSSFSQLPSVSGLDLSPNGSQIAFIENIQNPEISLLTTLNLETGDKKRLVKSDNEDVKINWFQWANEKTIIVSIGYASKTRSVAFKETRLLAIDVDEKDIKPRNLIRANSKSEHVSQFQDEVVSFLPGDPDHILVAIDLDIPNLPSVYKLNIYSRRKTRIERGKMDVIDWTADRQGNLRLGKALDYKTGEASFRIKIGDDQTWHKMFEYNALEEPGIRPLGFANDPNILYYKAYNDDKLALYKIDLTTKLSTLVFADPDYDFDGSLIYSRKSNDVIGIRHSNSDGGRIYWDENYDKFQKAINAAMPDTSNYLVDFSDDENIYTIYSENDFTPGAYFIGDRKERTIHLAFEQYPSLPIDKLSEHNLVTYATRDGTKIEGYLTLPKNTEGPIATILHPHGGPGAREYDGFDYWTSYFADRGYAVFRPNFRGSTGYGRQFAESQMQAWGLTMQDDLTDAANWLVEQKIADPTKMCIVGASYGGYAAIMAAIKTPDLFQCAVSFAGVMDLDMLVSKSRYFLNKKFIRKQIGEDEDDLEARSPYYHADKIKIPILLMHGEDDRVVDVRQSREMAEELEDLDANVKYVELKSGDHYLSIQRNRHRVFAEMDTFLKKYLNPTTH